MGEPGDEFGQSAQISPNPLPQQTPARPIGIDPSIQTTTTTTPANSTSGQTTRQQTPIEKGNTGPKKQQKRAQQSTAPLRKPNATKTMAPPESNISRTSTTMAPSTKVPHRTEAVLKPKDETTKERMDKKADEDTGLAELRSLIDPKMLRDLKEAKSEKEWKGGIRAFVGAITMYCRYVPPKVRQALFEDVASPTILGKSKAAKKELNDYFNNQIYETFGPYCEALERAAEEYLFKTDAGLYVQELYNKHIEKLKGASGIPKHPKTQDSTLTNRSLSGQSEWTLPFDFVSDFQPLTDVTQLLLFNDKVGMEFTSYQVVDINRRTLAFLELEDLGDGQVGWLAGPNGDAWLEVMATSTLMDILLFIIGRFAGEIPKRRKATPREGLGKDSKFGESLWRNRPRIPDSISRLPPVADWDKRVELFGKRFNLCVSNTGKLAGNSLHHYVLSGPDAVRIGEKHSNLKRNQDIFGDGRIEPFSRVMETRFGEPREHGSEEEEQPDLPTDLLSGNEDNEASPIEKPVDDDAILVDQPDIEDTRMHDDSQYIRSSFENFRASLNASGVRHPFEDNDNFEMMVGLFKVVTTPVKDEQSKIAALFARSSYMGQLKLGKTLAAHNQYLLAAMAAKFTEEAEAYDAKIAEYEAAMSAQLNILSIIERANEAKKAKAISLEDAKKEHARYMSARSMGELNWPKRDTPIEIVDSDNEDKRSDPHMVGTPCPIRGRTNPTPAFKTPMPLRQANAQIISRAVDEHVDHHTNKPSSRYKNDHRGSRHSSRRLYDDDEDIIYRGKPSRRHSRHSRHGTRYRSPHRERERTRDTRDTGRGRSRSRSRHYNRRDKSRSRSRSISSSYPDDSDTTNNHSSPDSIRRTRDRSRERSASRDRTRSHRHYSKSEKEHKSRHHGRDRDRERDKKRRRESDNYSGKTIKEPKKIKRDIEPRGSSEYGELDVDDVRALEEEEKRREGAPVTSTTADKGHADGDVVVDAGAPVIDNSMTTTPTAGTADSPTSTPLKEAPLSNQDNTTPTTKTPVSDSHPSITSPTPTTEIPSGGVDCTLTTPSPLQHSSFVTGSTGSVSGLRLSSKEGKKPLSLVSGVGGFQFEEKADDGTINIE